MAAADDPGHPVGVEPDIDPYHLVGGRVRIRRQRPAVRVADLEGHVHVSRIAEVPYALHGVDDPLAAPDQRAWQVDPVWAGRRGVPRHRGGRGCRRPDRPPQALAPGPVQEHADRHRAFAG